MQSERKIDRFDKYMEFKGLNDNKVTISLKLSVGTLGKSRKEGRDLSDKVVWSILNFYQDINKIWLITGEGQMLKSSENVVDYEENTELRDRNGILLSQGKVIPLYDAQAAADGDGYSPSMEASRQVGLIEIGGMLRDSEAAIRVYGNSMTPNYPPGCIIGTRPHRSTFIEPGTVYVVETEDERYIKRLYYNKDKTAFRCVSDNSMKHEHGPMEGEFFYPDFEIPFSEVKKIFRVIGVIKRNIM